MKKILGWAVYLLMISIMFIAISHLNYERSKNVKFCEISTLLECK